MVSVLTLVLRAQYWSEKLDQVHPPNGDQALVIGVPNLEVNLVAVSL